MKKTRDIIRDLFKLKKQSRRRLAGVKGEFTAYQLAHSARFDQKLILMMK